MSDLVQQRRAPARRPLGAVIWFIWMVGMWLAFFSLLFSGRLEDVWSAITRLPLLIEIVLWVVFLPWMLAAWVWTGPWPMLLRAALVLGFAVGWTVISIPRRRKQPGT